MMNTTEMRNFRDQLRRVNRKELYGSSRAHFPFPSKLTAQYNKGFSSNPLLSQMKQA